MEQLRASNSSKVTVEYSDPSGIFSLVSDDIQQILPLRNLHWNSSSRPLRSISSLYVELIPAQGGASYTGQEDAVPTQTSSANRDFGRAQHTGPRSRQSAESKKERRHQIPGLRQTPYLKIYWLRCDDTETYKNVSRKLLRDWVRSHTPSIQSSASINKVDNHDAFEWLIIHVLLPNGEFSKGSHISGISRGGGQGDKSSNTARWSARGSSTVLEKVRSDFNGTSKSAIDRVAQIQLGEDLDVSAVSKTSISTSDHLNDEKQGWNDLISKLKYLILASFDRRVSQYEDDIKEKDSQRMLPGWNFNTFFVLKEGLARGFESVGLVEDALTGYHELSAALKLIIDEQSTNLSAQNQTGLFREFTDDLREEFINATAALQHNQPKHDNVSAHTNVDRQRSREVTHDFGALILDTDRKPYRDMILANNISAYEFLCYVFARQVSLLLRLANASTSYGSSTDGKSAGSDLSREIHVKADQSEATMVGESGVNLLVLSEICFKAVDFITSVTRTIRNDLRTSTEDLAQIDEGVRGLSGATRSCIVENLVASWTFSAAQCILRKTSTKSLSAQLEPFLRQVKSQSAERSIFKENHIDALGSVKREKFPDRSSSLKSPPLGEPSIQGMVPPINPLDLFQLIPARSPQTGTRELAAQRAELTGLARRALGILGLRGNIWRGIWNDLGSDRLSDDDLDEVPLDTMRDSLKSIGEPLTSTNPLGCTGIRNSLLCSALMSKTSFYITYEDLTASMLALCVMSDRQKSTEALTAEIAAIRWYMGDYSAAVSYFHKLAPFYAKDDWSTLEMSMLSMYAQCLQKTNRDEEYVRVGLKIVAKVVRESKNVFRVQQNIVSKALCLSDLIFASRSLGEPISVSIDSYFGDISLDPYPKHYNDHDGFQLQLRFQNRTSQALEVEQIRVQIVSLEEDHQSSLWLAAEGVHILAPGAATILVGTKITIPGWYILNKIILRSGHILFSQDLSSFRCDPLIGPKESISHNSVDTVKPARILVWPSLRALEAHLSMHNKIHLAQPRSVDIEISTGWNHISHGKVSLRAGSAGLRLRTANAKLTSGNTTMVGQSQPGILGFGELFAESKMVLRIPYDLESDLKEITIKVEISYTTPMGDFAYACNPKISSLLPLGVNVQDAFQQNSLFSRFTINTANLVPLRISRCYIEGSDNFEVSSPFLGDERFDVFPRQPLSLVTKIRLKHEKGKSIRKGSAHEKLFLMIEYHALDQEILDAIEKRFSKALAASDFQDLVRLLIPVLLANSRSRLSVQGLEVIGLRREITLNTVVDIDWSTVISGLKPERRGELSRWLLNWHEKTPSIPIPDVSEASRLQHLVVPVDIPHMGIIHTACLNLHYPHLESSPELECAAVGQPIPAELVIKHTRRWLTQAEQSSKSQALEFCYEMQANSDTWLIGGRRKAHFSAKEDEISSFPLLLIPQRTGHLLYPSIDITESISSSTSDFHGEQKASGRPSRLCETDYRSQGETLLVIPNLGSTTVSLENGHSGSGSWLVDSKAREHFEI